MKSAARLCTQKARAGLPGGPVQSMPNMRYFSGFTGDSGMLILQENRRLLLTDPRYTEQAKLQAPILSWLSSPGAMSFSWPGSSWRGIP